MNWRLLFKKEQYEQNPRLYTIFLFLTSLLIFAVPLYIIASVSNLFALQVTIATQSHFLLSSLGYPVIQEGAHLTVGAFDFFISKDSTAWKSLLFLSALIISVPRLSRKKKLIGLAIGLPVIWIMNLFRVMAIVVVERSYGLELALFTHDFLWRWGLIATVLIFWSVWFFLSHKRLH